MSSIPTVGRFSTKELSEKTWPDFVELFEKKGRVGDGWWCWCTFHHTASFSSPKNWPAWTRAERASANKKRKKTLVDSNCAHGIPVYSDDEPVGWCQFGLREELPRTDNASRYQKLALKEDGEKLWRITCFVVDEDYRGKGVATTGLRAALESIRKHDGGVEEVYPVSKSDQGSNYHYCGTVIVREGWLQDCCFLWSRAGPRLLLCGRLSNST